jgi:hypothetical protein
MTPTPRPLSHVIKDMLAAQTQERISIGDILEAFHERGFGFILIILALPLFPVPPGLNTLFAVPMVILTAQQAMGRHTVWIPESWRKKSLPTAQFKKFLESMLPWVVRVEIFIKPRFGFMTQGVFSHLIGVCGLIMSLVACIPLPFTHAVPGFGVALMGAGVIMRDGLAVIAGAAIGLGWIAMLAFVILFLGAEGIDIIKQTFTSILT